MARIGVPVVIHAYYIESDAKAIVVFGYEWESMADEQKEKILAEKTVIMSGDSGYRRKDRNRL